MDLPFSREELLGVFVRFNEELWAVQVVAIALAGFVAALALSSRSRSAGRVVAALLAAAWAASGVAFHLRHFTRVNPAAHLFGWAFVAGAAGLLWAGARGKLSFEPRGWRAAVGGALVAYALVGYPLAGAAAGHVYPAVPVGLAPCPTTLLTAGVLLWAAPPVPRYVALVPFAWSVVGLSAAVVLGIVQDAGLAVAAFAAGAVLVDRRGAPGQEPRAAPVHGRARLLRRAQGGGRA